MSSKETIVDLSKYPSPDTPEYENLPDEVFQKLDLYASYTLEATREPTGQTFTSFFYCEKEVDGKYSCEGEISLIRYDIPKEIHWKCENCGDQGKIINFEGTFWDFSNLSQEEIDRRMDIIGVRDDESLELMDVFDDVFDEMNEKGKNDFFSAIDNLADSMDDDFDEFDDGLSTSQRYYLLEGNWKNADNSISISDDLPFGKVKDTFFLHNARTFLLYIQDRGKLPVTKSLRNLNLNVVADFIDLFIWPEGYIEEVKEMYKRPDEEKVWLLKVVHELLDMAGLIHVKKGYIYLTKKNTHLIKEENAGKLFQLLFDTLFNKMNIAFLTGGNREYPYFQDSIPYTLYKLHKKAQKWTSLKEMSEKILLPIAQEELSDYAIAGDINILLYYNLLRPLKLFGLLESRFSNNQGYLFTKIPDQLRLKPLFHDFLTFNIPDKNS
ncbi:MAG TPA: hypothetical protein VKA34_16175 [Balneolales bacterium]|nr:hypothetical protein [Balneolales bacterium]